MKVGHLVVGRRAAAAGFTIVETMVVLAVTGALFVAIAATLTGRQNEAQFVHAIQSVQSQIQQTIDQVSAGFFPATNLDCAAGANSLSFMNGVNGQGTNAQCVFLGKVMQFRVQGSSPEAYRIYTIAGKLGPGVGASSPYANVAPTVVGLTASSDYTTYSTPQLLEYGLTTVSMKIVGGANIGAVGFLMEPGGFASSGGYNSGAQPVDLVPIPGTTVNPSQSITTAVNTINTQLKDQTLTADAPINPPGGVQICFASGGTNESGLITIGGSGRQLIVSLVIKSNATCS